MNFYPIGSGWGLSIFDEILAEDRLKKKRANKPQFDLREGLFRLTSTDLTRIESIDAMAAMTVISKAGCDMSKWETQDHFVSWLRL